MVFFSRNEIYSYYEQCRLRYIVTNVAWPQPVACRLGVRLWEIQHIPPPRGAREWRDQWIGGLMVAVVSSLQVQWGPLTPLQVHDLSLPYVILFATTYGAAKEIICKFGSSKARIAMETLGHSLFWWSLDKRCKMTLHSCEVLGVSVPPCGQRVEIRGACKSYTYNVSKCCEP